MTKRKIWRIEVDSDECPHNSGRYCYCDGVNNGKLCKESKCPCKVEIVSDDEQDI